MFTPRADKDPLEGRFDQLDRSGRMIARLARRPVWPVLAMVLLTAGLAWWFLMSMAGSIMALQGSARPLGPGMSLISSFLPVEPGSFAATIADLCLSADSGMVLSGGSYPALAMALFVMWFAMSAAMMLPAAAPMIRTYAEIADTAVARGEPVIHPAVLTAGYLSVWALAAAGFTLVQLAITQLSGSSATSPVKGVIAGLVLLCAGLYQFTALKQACLTKCRNPFTTLFARWKTTARGVLRLGMEQGLWCLGCCWALMLIMLAVGSMNVVWMAALTLFTFLEKTGAGRVTTKAGGAIICVWGAALIWSTFA
jgi:predicted metal-binding membrane protein